MDFPHFLSIRMSFNFQKAVETAHHSFHLQKMTMTAKVSSIVAAFHRFRATFG